MSRTLIVALVLAVAAVASSVIATKHVSAPAPWPHVTDVDLSAAVSTDSAERSISSRDAADAPSPETTTSDEERAAAIKRAISNALENPRDSYAKQLEESGLAPADSQQIAQRLIDAVANCIFESARTEYETQGMGPKEFLDGAEMVWSRPTQVELSLRVRSRAVPCVATAYQQAGIPAPADFGSSSDELSGSSSTESARPPWAGEMEARIREHISSYRAPNLSRVLAQCRSDGCSVLIAGHDIRVFDLDFDRFAEQNGFRHAVLGGDSSLRAVWLQRE